MTEWQRTKCAASYNLWRYVDEEKQIIEIQLTRGYTTLIEAEDKDRILPYKLHYNPRGYAIAKVKNKNVYVHKLVMGAPFADHINRKGLDNRRSNLRRADPNINNNNMRIFNTNKTGVNGVRLRIKEMTYISAWWRNGKEKSKSFGFGPKCSYTKEEAFEAACKLRLEMDLEHGCTNGHKAKET
jgi:hypothetical protein